MVIRPVLCRLGGANRSSPPLEGDGPAQDDLEFALATRRAELRSLAAIERRWRRPAPSVGNLSVGRSLFKTRGAIQKLKRADGTWETRNDKLLGMLWQSRSSL